MKPNYQITSILPELYQVESLIAQGNDQLDVNIIDEIPLRDKHFPIYAISLGSTAPDAPNIAFVGGIHGLEKIGTQRTARTL